MERIKNLFGDLGQLPYVWAAFLAAWGGIVAYLQRLTEQNLPFSILRLLAEMTTSAFVGVVVYLACGAMSLNDMPTAVLVAVSGHMGTRALVLLEQYYTRLLRSRFPGGGDHES